MAEIEPDEGQKLIDDWFRGLPNDIENIYSFLLDNTKKFQTFDLLSYFSYYNHLHDPEEYSDYRGDKHFFVSEVIALLCLKSDFVSKSTISEEDYMELIIEMQKKVLNYCGKSDALDTHKQRRGENSISDITSLLSREAKHIRNPGLPDHHLIFVEKLFEPVKEEIKSLFGFTVSDSITIRRILPYMINQKCQKAINDVLEKGNKYAKEIFKFRKTRKIETGSVFTSDQLNEFSLLPDKQIKQGLQSHLLNELFYTFSKIYTFTAEELADWAKVELLAVKAFLKTFSCSFPSLKSEDKIYEPITILKSKPILEHNGKFLVPSIPLLTWAVEDVTEATFRVNPKLNTKYNDIKHHFLLNQGLEYFKVLLPSATLNPSNLFYTIKDDSYETDALIIYDKILFIIEAKGHRITQKAKSGHELRTQDHLKDIIRDSYSQGIRTLKYIEENETAEFRTKEQNKIIINRKDFDDIIIVSLTLEPIGNLSMAIKVTNDLGYFNDDHFPWIISIYDLVVLADLFENPIMLVHYIKRRKKFLSSKLLSTYEELDLVSYFLFNGLFVEQTLKDAEAKNVNWIEFSPNTDAINDYYMYKFGTKKKFTSKPKFYISEELNEFLLQLDRSKMPHRVRMALLLLEFNNKSIKELMNWIKKIKKTFAKDKAPHDCSIFTQSSGGLGVTFMTGQDQGELSYRLHKYCTYKLNQQNSNKWIGFGDISTNRKVFNFKSMFFASR